MDGSREVPRHRVNEQNYSLQVNGKEVRFTRRIFLIFAVFHKKPETYFSREDLQNEGTLKEYSLEGKRVDVALSEMRSCLRQAGVEGWLINERGVGWKWSPQPLAPSTPEPEVPEAEEKEPPRAPPTQLRQSAPGHWTHDGGTIGGSFDDYDEPAQVHGPKKKYRRPHPSASSGVPRSEKARRRYFYG